MDLPLPRLELRWEPMSENGNNWKCRYLLCVGLHQYDCRRNNEKADPSVMEIEIGNTDSQRGNPPVDERGEVDTPFRDGAHARWDGWQLRLPIYATCGLHSTRVVSTDPHQEGREIRETDHTR